MNNEQVDHLMRKPKDKLWDALQRNKTDVLTALQLMEKGVIESNSLRVIALRLDKDKFASVEQIQRLVQEGDASIPGFHWEVSEDDRGYAVILKPDQA